jgi:mannose-6-phosphate isomerase-like protein (cupin superfamily)
MIKKHNLRDVEFKPAPNRKIAELVSGDVLGSRNVTFRIVDIVPLSQQKLRHPHSHQDFEETIFILSGRGKIWAEGESMDVEEGDALLIPAGVVHMIMNTTEEPLRLACFFPVREGVANRTRAEESVDPKAILDDD